ncbi:TetR/AcrR family transcriptional regulator [Kineosporia rhizophila]|uniref:TetR/AcrR family transcriptional regulator n=1 Tax=Kineosporia TaxID=49184 RepID=UPI001E3FC92A|nr:TetR/AcrR family transcriptional regulator [Kineosporia sp. NBRC 101677]MCE0537859.1 TetR/AcrR family transcriptional regulator [Kineosporia rhizophila]GLY15849.1 TetR family transcriptional regulator [Kineosporia sp. NBRC 101677]
MTPQKAGGRRAEYAAATRQAILTAARELFVERGYFGTKVDDIASQARVAAPTVYAVGGGKSGLLLALIQEGVNSSEAEQAYQQILAQSDPAELVAYLVEATRAMFESWSPLMRQVIAAAPQEAAVRETLALANAGMRQGMVLAARRLDELGGLRPGVSADRAADVFWYYLGNASYFTLTDELAWSPPQAAEWLHQQLVREVLPPA